MFTEFKVVAKRNHTIERLVAVVRTLSHQSTPQSWIFYIMYCRKPDRELLGSIIFFFFFTMSGKAPEIRALRSIDLGVTTSENASRF